MGVVDEVFKGVLRFRGVVWAPFGDVDFGTCFLCGVGVSISIPGSAPAGAGPNLLLRLGFVPHVDVLDIDAFFVIIL